MDQQTISLSSVMCVCVCGIFVCDEPVAFGMWLHAVCCICSSVSYWCDAGSRFQQNICRLHFKCDGTRAENRFHFSAKRTSPFKSAGEWFQSTTGSRVVCISSSNAGYIMFRSSTKNTGYTHQSPVFPTFPSHASPCSNTFQLHSTTTTWCHNPADHNLNTWCCYSMRAHRA